MSRSSVSMKPKSLDAAENRSSFISNLILQKAKLNDSSILKDLISHTENLISKATESKDIVNLNSKELEVQHKKFEDIEHSLLELKSKIDRTRSSGNHYSLNDVMQSKESIHTKEHHTDRETVNLKNRERNKQSKYNTEAEKSDVKVEDMKSEKKEDIQSASTNFLINTLEELETSKSTISELNSKLTELQKFFEKSKSDFNELTNRSISKDKKYKSDILELNSITENLDQKVKDLKAQLNKEIERIKSLELEKVNN